MANYFLKYLKINLKEMTEFRFSFIFDIIMMFFVNFAFYGSVIYLAYNNNGLAGFSYEEVVLAVTIMELAYILGIGLFKGIDVMQYKIINGELDSLLIRPINPYFHILIHRINFRSLGEIPTFILLLLMNSPENFLFIIFFGIMSAIIFNLSVCLFNCIPLFIKINNEINFLDLIIGFSNYPPGIFNSFMKFIGLFIFPGCMVGFGPILMMKNPLFAIVYFGFIAILIIAFDLIFNLGLKKYESAGY